MHGMDISKLLTECLTAG